jgi:hypothetical protein
MQHYVYKITNKCNGKYYIGYHCGELDDDYYGSGLAIGRAVKRHGKEQFTKEVLVVATNKVAGLFLEKAFIGDLWKTADCYNCCEGGGMPPSFLGKKRGPQSAEHRAKIRATREGKTYPNISAAQLGKKRGPHSAETRAKMSEVQKGKKRKPLSDETKAKLAAAIKAVWDKRKGLV